ncbi:MAG: DUF861 domain-containing protein [Actinobacteria bacterium]|nr:DUF861 domain-containing protein [Actinomycetota bacterium]
MSEPVPSLNVEKSDFEPLPEYGGSQCILYRSPDRTRLAGSFKESGSHEMTMPYDEFVYVVAGGVSITVEDGPRQGFGVGDAFYVRQGTTVRWEMTDDFQDVTVLISDHPIDV